MPTRVPPCATCLARAARVGQRESRQRATPPARHSRRRAPWRRARARGAVRSVPGARPPRRIRHMCQWRALSPCARRSAPPVAACRPPFLRGAAALGVRHAVPTDPPALARRGVILRLAATGTGLLSAVRHGVHGCPGTLLGHLVGHTAIFVALLDVLRLPLLLVRV